MNVRVLRSLSIGYLLLPNLLFYFYWTRPIVAVAGIGLLVYLFISQIVDKNFPLGERLSRVDLVYIGLTALLLTLASGVAGICWQTFDHWGHNTKFYDLFLHEWPLRFPDTGPAISYYYGYFLVPALISKSLGYISELAIFIWTFIGICLGIAWLYLVLNKKIVFVLMSLCVGSTAYIIINIAFKLGVPLLTYEHVEITMSPISLFLLWVPNQVIPTLIIVGMAIYLLSNKIKLEEVIFPITLSFWWAVFPSFSSGILIGILIVVNWIKYSSKVDWPYTIKKVFLPLLACLPILLIYKSHHELPVKGFIWQFGGDVRNVATLYIIEIIVPVFTFLALFSIHKKKGANLPDYPFYLAMALTLLLSLVMIGVYNDFQSKGVMVYTLIMGIYLLVPLSYEHSYLAVSRLARKSFFNFALLYFFFSSFYLSIHNYKRALKVNMLTVNILKAKFKPYPYDKYMTSYDFLESECSSAEAKQYLGVEGSLYEVYIKSRESTKDVYSNLELK